MTLEQELAKLDKDILELALGAPTKEVSTFGDWSIPDLLFGDFSRDILDMSIFNSLK